MSHVDRMTERERYRIRGAYYVYLGDPQKCVEEYHSMLKLYPSDALGHGNLAYCYDQVHDYGAAVSELQLAIKLMPKYVNWQLNLAFAYAHLGDFRKAEAQIKTVLQSSPSFEQAYWVLAFTELAQDREAEAIETYKAVSKLSPLGESLSASGLADVALYDGRFSEAVSLLEGGVRADTAAKNGRVAEKYVVLGESQLQWGHTDPAIAAAKLALKHTQKVNARFLAARVLVEAGDMTTAHAAGKALGAEIGSEAQADSRIIEGDIALKERNPRKAIQLFSEANKIFESWMGHFDLGRAYFDAGLYVEANSEFDRCITGRGKAVDMLDAPTFGFVPPAYYYLARTEQALGSPGAADAYRHFISMESKGKGGALLQDAKERLADLASKQ
jgi:tetratricopeptide (TPR) repeat protein